MDYTDKCLALSTKFHSAKFQRASVGSNFPALLKVLDIKYGPGADVSLKEYLEGFSDDIECYIDEITLDIKPYLTKLNEISLPELELSQIECLIYIAGYAVFSFLKKFNGCHSGQDLLSSDKYLEVNNDVGSQHILIDLVDRG